jgi:hypothetical protein
MEPFKLQLLSTYLARASCFDKKSENKMTNKTQKSIPKPDIKKLSRSDADQIRLNLGMILCEKVLGPRESDVTTPDEKKRLKKERSSVFTDEGNRANVRKNFILFSWEEINSKAHLTFDEYWRYALKIQPDDRLISGKLLHETSHDPGPELNPFHSQLSLVNIVCNEIANKYDLLNYFERLKKYQIGSQPFESSETCVTENENVVHLEEPKIKIFSEDTLNCLTGASPVASSVNTKHFQKTYPEKKCFEHKVGFSSDGWSLYPESNFNLLDERINQSLDLCPTIILGDVYTFRHAWEITFPKSDNLNNIYKRSKESGDKAELRDWYNTFKNKIEVICPEITDDDYLNRCLSSRDFLFSSSAKERAEQFRQAYNEYVDPVINKFDLDDMSLYSGSLLYQNRIHLSIMEENGKIIPVISTNGKYATTYQTRDVEFIWDNVCLEFNKNSTTLIIASGPMLADPLSLELKGGCRSLNHWIFSQPFNAPRMVFGEDGPHYYESKLVLWENYGFSDFNQPTRFLDFTFDFDGNIAGCKSHPRSILGMLERHILSADFKDTIFARLDENARGLSDSLNFFLTNKTKKIEDKMDDFLEKLSKA